MSGTMRGTPAGGRNQPRGNVPFATSSPGNSGIPRPVLDAQQPSEAASAVSASRQKQSKRDEVGLCHLETPGPTSIIQSLPNREAASPSAIDSTICMLISRIGYPPQAGERPLQEEARYRPSSTHPKSASRDRPRPKTESGPADQTEHYRIRGCAINGREARGLRFGNG